MDLALLCIYIHARPLSCVWIPIEESNGVPYSFTNDMSFCQWTKIWALQLSISSNLQNAIFIEGCCKGFAKTVKSDILNLIIKT